MLDSHETQVEYLRGMRYNCRMVCLWQCVSPLSRELRDMLRKHRRRLSHLCEQLLLLSGVLQVHSLSDSRGIQRFKIILLILHDLMQTLLETQRIKTVHKCRFLHVLLLRNLLKQQAYIPRSMCAVLPTRRTRINFKHFHEHLRMPVRHADRRGY